MGKNILIVVIFLGLVGVAYFFFKRSNPGGDSPVPHYALGTSGKEGPCPGETMTLEQRDVYMRGIIDKGQKFDLIPNYYACHEAQKGELIYYQFSNQMEPVIKRVVGVGGDKFNLVQDSQHHGWNLEINGAIVQGEGGNYFFGGVAPPTLSLYIESRKGVLRPGELIIFSSFPPGDTDSGTLGIVSIKDVVGKVEPVGGLAKEAATQTEGSPSAPLPSPVVQRPSPSPAQKARSNLRQKKKTGT